MRPLTASKLLRVWERTSRRTAVERTLLLLAAACPERSVEELARLSIGKRDALLIALREWTFGPRFVACVPCAACQQTLEISFDVSDIRVEPTNNSDDLSVKADGYEVHFRLPNSEDVASLGGLNAESAEEALLRRCVLRLTAGGQEESTLNLPASVWELVSQRMVAADPQAQIEIAMSCVSCSHKWSVTFDIVSYFWNELNGWAQRILREVHALASAYGWHEEEILSLSPWRRQLYVDLVNGR